MMNTITYEVGATLAPLDIGCWSLYGNRSSKNMQRF